MVVTSDPTPARGNRRIKALVLGGIWRNSWRNSNQTLVSNDGLPKNDDDAIITSSPKRVHFPEVDFLLVTEIPAESIPITPEEAGKIWYQNDDYVRFEKDRVLTCFGYMSSKRGGSCSFDEDHQTIRGLENVVDCKRCRRENGERKELRKAILAEEERQKEEKTFPDLKMFRSVSLKHTKVAKERALALAAEDAKQARRRRNVDGLSPLQRLRRKSLVS